VFIRVYYTDLALHKFRELRHESFIFLSENVKNGFSLNEAIEHRDFLQNVDAVVENFDKIKIAFVKFKSVKIIYNGILFSSEKFAKIKEDNSESLLPYRIKFVDALMTSFQAIPFFRIRLFMYLGKLILSILIKLGFSQLRKHLFQLEKLYRIEKDVSNDNGCLT
jgi:hypothetical protein